jgi:hypothetical protein
MAEKDAYSFTVSTEGNIHRLEVKTTPMGIHRLLATLLEPLGNSQNGAAPARAAAGGQPAAHAAKPPHRQRKRRGRPKRGEEKHYHDNVKTVAIQRPLEKTCAFCSNRFSSKFSGARYCSPRCKERAHAVAHPQTEKEDVTVVTPS